MYLTKPARHHHDSHPSSDYTMTLAYKRAVNEQEYYYSSYLLYTASSANISHNVKLSATVFRPALRPTFTCHFPK